MARQSNKEEEMGERVLTTLRNLNGGIMPRRGGEAIARRAAAAARVLQGEGSDGNFDGAKEGPIFMSPGKVLACGPREDAATRMARLDSSSVLAQPGG